MRQRRFWGAPGKYSPRGMLKAFAEEMGLEYEQLLEGAMDESEPISEDSDLLLAVARQQLWNSVRASHANEILHQAWLHPDVLVHVVWSDPATRVHLIEAAMAYFRFLTTLE